MIIMGFSPFQYLILIILVSVCCLPTFILATVTVQCHAHERTALLQFKHSFKIDCSVSIYAGTESPLKSWTGDQANFECCSWDGVECNEKTGNVIELHLDSSCLYGTFPQNSSLFNLSHLETLDLSDNDFNHSHIPSEIGQLSKLRDLKFRSSLFGGQIPPEILNLSELRNLDLSLNSLTLKDPSLERLVISLTHLQVLVLSTVDISSVVPHILVNKTSLTNILLEECNLHGEIPKGIFGLPQLESLALDYNPNLKGTLPDFQQNSLLRYLYLSFTAFSGEVPLSIGNLAHLELFGIRSCGFFGHIPSSLGSLTKLRILDLGGNYFSGDIPPSLLNSTQFQLLDLSNLNLKLDRLFSWLPKLNKLTSLRVSHTNLQCEVPSFLANFTGLTKLDLSGNQLHGQIPAWLMNLTQLELLDITDNLLSGPIPQGISQLVDLIWLKLGDNKLYGNFEAFSKLKYLSELQLHGLKLTFPSPNAWNESVWKIKILNLESCNLTEFPYLLHNQDQLQELRLADNLIQGNIPQWFVNITANNLHNLYLENNFLTGFEQPTEVLPWSQLEELFLSSNNIKGSLPVPPNSLVLYNVNNNLFDGGIPQQICHATSLRYLHIAFNNMGGQLPDCFISELGASLSFMLLQGNNFSGVIPDAFPKSCQLKMVSLNQNKLEGKMPRSLGHCGMLEVLNIGNNLINDTFPSWLGSLQNLKILLLRYNNFHGRIGKPNAEFDFPSLHIIDVSNNFHTGDLPSNYFQQWDSMAIVDQNQSAASGTGVLVYPKQPHGERHYIDFHDMVINYSIDITIKGKNMLYPKVLTVFRVIDFSSNNFTGRIPNSIGKLKGVQALNLSNNNLDGDIPSSLTNLTELESFDLSNNLLEGEMPEGFAQLTSLEVFNVSHNHLVGPIPQGNQFNTFDNSSFQGNTQLCGSPLSIKCGDTDEPPVQQPINEEEDDQDLNWIDWMVRSLGCVGGFGFVYAIGKYITDQNHDWFVETFGTKRPKRSQTRARPASRHRS